MVPVHPPVEVDGQVFDARSEPHVGHTAQRQQNVIAQGVGRDALVGELGEARVETRRQFFAVGFVGGGEAGGLGMLRGRVESAAGQER